MLEVSERALRSLRFTPFPPRSNYPTFNLIISDEISDFYCFCKKKELILPNFCILRKDSGIQYF